VLALVFLSAISAGAQSDDGPCAPVKGCTYAVRLQVTVDNLYGRSTLTATYDRVRVVTGYYKRGYTFYEPRPGAGRIDASVHYNGFGCIFDKTYRRVPARLKLGGEFTTNYGGHFDVKSAPTRTIDQNLIGACEGRSLADLMVGQGSVRKDGVAIGGGVGEASEGVADNNVDSLGVGVTYLFERPQASTHLRGPLSAIWSARSFAINVGSLARDGYKARFTFTRRS
jgi:hypothetical protein